jgi:hypothetical protein
MSTLCPPDDQHAGGLVRMPPAEDRDWKCANLLPYASPLRKFSVFVQQCVRIRFSPAPASAGGLAVRPVGQASYPRATVSTFCAGRSLWILRPSRG